METKQSSRPAQPDNPRVRCRLQLVEAPDAPRGAELRDRRWPPAGGPSGSRATCPRLRLVKLYRALPTK